MISVNVFEELSQVPHLAARSWEAFVYETFSIDTVRESSLRRKVAALRFEQNKMVIEIRLVLAKILPPSRHSLQNIKSLNP